MPRRRKRSSPLTLVLLVLAAVIVLLAVLLRGPLSSALWRALGPVMAWRQSLSADEVAQLKAQLASTTAALADRDALAAQNAALKLELGRGEAGHGVVAAIIMQPPATPYDTLVIDAGSTEGIMPGQQVRAGALVVGIVDEAGAQTARVALYSSPGQSYQATLVTQSTAVPVSVEGQGAGSMQARVPASTDVRVGDRVEFPGLSNLQAGRVSGIEGADTDTFKTIHLSLPVDPFALRYVFVQK